MKRIVLDRETMELRALRVFSRVARLRGVTAAGEELGLPKSAVSKLLSRLEEQLGARLLDRTSRRVSLTPVGEAVLSRAESLLADADALTDAVGEARDRVRGHLVVAAPPDLGAHLASDFVPRFLAAYPELTLQLSLDYRYADLVDPAFDLAFRIGDVHDDRLVARKVGVARRLLVASPSFVRQQRIRSVAQLARAPALIFGDGPAAGSLALSDGRREKALHVKGRLSASSFPALLRAAEAGLGVAFMPEIVAREALSRGTVTRVLPNWFPPPSPILLVHRPGHQRIRRVAALIEFASRADSGVPR